MVDRERVFMQVAEAMAESAIRAGCRFYAGYPITPSTAILEYMARKLPAVGGVCMFPGTEIEGVTMVQGAAGCGVRSMIASTSTAISLMQETFAECANGEWPIVVVDVCRSVLQGDYHQAVKGGGHGDYRFIVLGPQNGQEAIDLMALAFELADKYRHPVMMLVDTIIAHTTETLLLPLPTDVASLPAKEWATNGAEGRERRAITFVGETGLSTDIIGAQRRVQRKLKQIAEDEALLETGLLEDAEVMLVAYGTAARFAKIAIERLRLEDGLKIGFFRPITLSPYPSAQLAAAARGRRLVLCYELNAGQMIDDVRSAIYGEAPIRWFGGEGKSQVGFGTAWSVEDIMGSIRELVAAENTESAERLTEVFA
ncbi:MAG: 3-methyl-2-oxobutanoate dehydrogenase subunit beta [Dehalococcoidia bacterium]